METLFDWSDIPEPDDRLAYRNEDGTVDWRKRCLHLAYAADALQIACIGSIAAPAWLGPRDQIQAAGDAVFYQLDNLRSDYARETRDERGFDDESYHEDIEIERVKPALKRMLHGIRSDDRLATILKALADAIHDSAAEVGEDASQEARDLRAVCRRWGHGRE